MTGLKLNGLISWVWSMLSKLMLLKSIAKFSYIYLEFNSSIETVLKLAEGCVEL